MAAALAPYAARDECQAMAELERARANVATADAPAARSMAESEVAEAEEALAAATKRRAALDEAGPLLGALADALRAHVSDGATAPMPAPACEEFVAAAQRLSTLGRAAKGKGGGAAWERVQVEWGAGPRPERLEVMLRALDALGWAAEHEALLEQPGWVGRDEIIHSPRLVALTPSRVGQRLLAGHSTVVLDATPSRALVALVTSRGGRVEREGAGAPWHILHDGSHSHGIGMSRSTGSALQEAWAQVSIALRHKAEAGGARTVILTHLRFARVIIERGWWPEADVTWWGRHRATNDFAGANLVIFGARTMPPGAQMARYVGDRALALAAGAPQEEWPAWDGGQVLDGDHRHFSEPKLKAWWQDYVANELAQAVGRARLGTHPDAKVWVHGPAPVAELAALGIVAAEAAPTTSPQTAKREADATRRKVDVREVAIALLEAGQEVSRRHLRGAGAHGASTLLDVVVRDGQDLAHHQALLRSERAGLSALEQENGLIIERVVGPTGRCRVVARPDPEWRPPPAPVRAGRQNNRRVVQIASISPAPCASARMARAP